MSLVRSLTCPAVTEWVTAQPRSHMSVSVLLAHFFVFFISLMMQMCGLDPLCSEGMSAEQGTEASLWRPEVIFWADRAQQGDLLRAAQPPGCRYRPHTESEKPLLDIWEVSDVLISSLLKASMTWGRQTRINVISRPPFVPSSNHANKFQHEWIPYYSYLNIFT